jgi:hypothetical protein
VKKATRVAKPAPKSSKQKDSQVQVMVLPMAARPVAVQTLRLVIPSKPYQYGILTHKANPEYQYLAYFDARGLHESTGCFACFPLEYLRFNPALMPCVELKPAPQTLDVGAIKEWWRDTQFPKTGEPFDGQSFTFPVPVIGFKVGDYVSFKHRPPGSYGWVSAVLMRGAGRQLYLVCAVIQGRFRLIMAHRWELAGPDFTFVPPAVPFWSPKVFYSVHAKHPERLSHFEAPAGGFDVGDPVTVLLPSSKESVDAIVSFVCKTQDVPLSYNVQLPHGQILLYKEEDVLGPRVDRLNRDLDPAHLTPDPALLEAVSKHDQDKKPGEPEDDWRKLLTDEVMEEIQISGPLQGEPSAATYADMFVTPERDLTVPCMIRTCTGCSEIPYPGVLIAQAAARIAKGAGSLP